MLKIGLVSLGCAKNLVDSENILGLLKHDGYTITSSINDSDVIIVNTCGFIDSSKKESIETIFEMLSYNKKVVVTGCLAERYLEELKKEIPEVYFIPIRDYNKFNDLFKNILPGFTQTHVHCVGDAIQPSHPLSSPSPPALNLSQHQGLFK